jgi:hypothetical protein
MPGVPRNLIEHSLNVDPKATPKRQHLRRFADDRRDAIKKELAKLLTADFIIEVFYPEWLSNPVLVRKKNSNEWRMCVDYTDLNKHCPKDPFVMSLVDQVIDSTAGCDLLCFLDCYSGYHQIAIKEEDQEKTAFITLFGAYCYTTMSFGLKNAGATYQRAIHACFKRQLNKNIEAYVDDVVIKTRDSETLIADLEETFASLREYRWKLNPNKSVFGVPSGKLLGFIISHCGIEANPEKISSITNMRAPTLHQRCPEAYRVHGRLEQIYLESWRMGATLLQTTQASREVRVDSRGRSSSHSAEGFPIQAASPHDSS